MRNTIEYIPLSPSAKTRIIEDIPFYKIKKAESIRLAYKRNLRKNKNALSTLKLIKDINKKKKPNLKNYGEEYLKNKLESIEINLTEMLENIIILINNGFSNLQFLIEDLLSHNSNQNIQKYGEDSSKESLESMLNLSSRDVQPNSFNSHEIYHKKYLEKYKYTYLLKAARVKIKPPGSYDAKKQSIRKKYLLKKKGK